MKRLTIISLTILALLCITALQAEPNFRGYSGAPGCMGACAASCHGSGGGTIEISGFPEEYIPGETYEVMISHNGGSTIRQFNGSCRVGTGSQNAGVISSGQNTATYTTGTETNGIRFSSTNQSSGTFNWTAPESGTGNVKLYIAGLQGGYSGANSTLVLESDEIATGINDAKSIPSSFVNLKNYPNPFNASTVISFNLDAPAAVTLDMFNISGQKVATLFDGSLGVGDHSIRWSADDFSSGIYFCLLSKNGQSYTTRLSLIK